MRRAWASPLVLFRSRSTALPGVRRRCSHSLPPLPLKPSAALTDEEIAEIHRLVPRLCDAGRHADAVHLLTTALLTDPPISSLPLLYLADRLTSLPDMADAMSLLTALRHHPRRPSPLPFCSALLVSYIHRRRAKEAEKVFCWLLRPDAPCRPDAEVYRIAIEGLCRLRKMVEALRAVKEMAADRVRPGSEIRVSVYRGLLREARVDEARELDAALKKIEEDGEGFDRVDELLDKMIREWVD